jgi:hypothetical protein
MRVTVTDKNSTFLPADSYLHIRGQIITDKSVSPTVALSSGQAALVNSGWSLFYDATYKQNGVPVEQFINPGRVHNIHGLINYSDDYARGQGKEQMWSPDKGDGAIDDMNVSGIIIYNATTPAVVAQTLQWAATTNSVITASGSLGTAGDLIDLYFNGQKIEVSVDGAKTQLLVATVTTTIGYTGITAGDVVKFYVGGKELKFCNPIYNQSINIVATATALAANNSTAFTVQDLQAHIRDYEAYNSGYNERRIRGVVDFGVSTNRIIEMWLPLREIFKLFQEHPMPIRGATQEINFRKELPKNYLYADSVAIAAYPNMVFKYLKFSWWLPVIDYKLEVETKYLSMLNSKSMPISWHGYQYEEKGGLSSQSGTEELATINSLPRRVYVWFVAESREDSFAGNNRIFDNYDMRSIYLKINTTKYPEYTIEIDYGRDTGSVGDSGDDYMRAYNAYLSACGNVQHSWDCTPAISYEEFKTLYTVYCFDIYDKTENLFKANQSLKMYVSYQMRNSPTSYIAGNYKICAVFDPENEIVYDYKEGKIAKLIASDTI